MSNSKLDVWLREFQEQSNWQLTINTQVKKNLSLSYANYSKTDCQRVTQWACCRQAI